jgi:integrase/recombinase XerD
MRRALQVADWPKADVALFEALYRSGSVLDEHGPFADHRAGSRRTTRFAYACWLGWLSVHDTRALAEPPATRATAPRLMEWAASRNDLSAISISSLLSSAIHPLMAMSPDLNWTAQRRVLDRLRHRAQRHRSHCKAGRVQSSSLLLRVGTELATCATGRPPLSLSEARSRRDGAMIAVLSLLPIRRRAFCNIELGRNVDLHPPFRITVDPDLSKTGTLWTALIPVELVPVLDDYLRYVRPFLAGRSVHHDPALWLNDHGRRLAPNTMTGRITAATKKSLGVAISPHLFRDAAATTMVTQSPQAARAVRDILGHKGFDIVDKHYNHAKMIDASRLYAGMLA